MTWDKLGKIKLLVVDDDEFNRQLVMSLMSQIGNIEFLEAEDGIEALSILKQTEIDMVLLDLHMPNLNGYDTLLAIKKEPNYKHIPVAILTTDEQEKRKRCLKCRTFFMHSDEANKFHFIPNAWLKVQIILFGCGAIPRGA